MIVGCLALNASFEPLTMVPMRRALRLVIDGKAEIVEADHDRVVRSERLTMPRPAVIRLTQVHPRAAPLPPAGDEHVPVRARPLPLPVLRPSHHGAQAARVADARSPDSALARRHERLDERRHRLQPVQHAQGQSAARARSGCTRCTQPVEPHFVHLSWAVRRLTPTQARYIRTFYGSEVLHHLEQLEHAEAHPHRRAHA